MSGTLSFHAGIVSARFFETWDFYTAVLGFRTIEENDGYVRLRHPCGAELSVLEHELNGDWSQLVNATDARGFWLMLEVDEPATLRAQLVAAGIDHSAGAGVAKWGETGLVTRDPNGVLIFVRKRDAFAHESQRDTFAEEPITAFSGTP